jgi:hypothetical protein
MWLLHANGAQISLSSSYEILMWIYGESQSKRPKIHVPQHYYMQQLPTLEWMTCRVTFDKNI